MTQLKNATFDLRRSQSQDFQNIIFESIQHVKSEYDRVITHLPYELISTFLLAQNNNESILKFYSFGEDQNIPIKNVEKSGKSLSYLLHAIRENQNIIRRELRMLSGEYVSADGLPLPKSAIETLIKIYDIYYQKCKSRIKERLSIRDLIDKIQSYTYSKNCNGEEKVRILVHILLLSSVSISSHIYEGEKKDVVSRSNLFHISSDNFTKEAEIIRLLSDKANEKTEENKKDGGKKTGRIMDACREIFIDFRASAFEKLAAKHNEIKNKKLKAKGQFFSYNLGFNNADARLCAVLDLLKPYNKELNSDGSVGIRVSDKTFSLDCMAQLMGVAAQLSERKDRFYESIINAASVYGEIHLTKHNIRILFNKYISFEDTATSVGLVGDEEPNSVGLVGSPPPTQSDLSEDSVGLVGSPPPTQSDLSVLSVGSVGNGSNDLCASKIKSSLVDQVDLKTTSNTSNDENLSFEIEQFINNQNETYKAYYRQLGKKLGLRQLEKNIRNSKEFKNYKANSYYNYKESNTYAS